MKVFFLSLLFASLLLSSPSPVLVSAIKTSPSPTVDDGPFPADLNGSNFTYPWPVKLYRFTSQGRQLEMAFMDVPAKATPSKEPSQPSQPSNKGNNKNKKNTKTVVLLHGRNFCAATWQETASVLSAAGYRVIIPDQIGFCKSSKPGAAYQFSLHQLALNTRGLLETLLGGATESSAVAVTIIGHSMGGMLAARYALMYPSQTTALVLVNPIGLEDWKALGVPYQSIDDTALAERASNYASIRAYEQATYYPGREWTQAYDVWVRMLANIYAGSKAEAFALTQARVVDMVLTQPVVYEFPLIKAPPRGTLLLVGLKDNTAIGKQWSLPEVQARLGHYDVLGKQAATAIPNCTLVEFSDLGHAPQIQEPARFHGALLDWLEG
ncbi:Alpha/Beta hydrolase protein [Apodospora peruviana]|uniref:Alpha/Beta hydrolase protein n=1 Tax=Apodospora peruviana TaxID=516989 RepID=A0AAE0ME70_9PEZI|nr:Alpha/Beta hydrolase protein [Apodospora peruviana]